MREALQRWLRVADEGIRRVIGAPDYDAYLRHARARHPLDVPLSREEFVRRRLEDRYTRPGSRCC